MTSELVANLSTRSHATSTSDVNVSRGSHATSTCALAWKFGSTERGAKSLDRSKPRRADAVPASRPHRGLGELGALGDTRLRRRLGR